LGEKRYNRNRYGLRFSRMNCGVLFPALDVDNPPDIPVASHYRAIYGLPRY